MSDSSYQEAKLQLIKMFNKPSDFRHIIFWYDETQTFIEEIKNDSFDNAKIVVYENNPFSIKTLLEIEDTKSNYLIYFPCKRPADVENWLLDTLLYSEEYYADVVALTMRNLGLETSKLREVIQRHLSFFENKQRVADLQKRLPINDAVSPEDMELSMMASLVRADYSKIEQILLEIIFDVDSGKKYNELEKYNFKNDFWTMVSEQYFYSGEESVDTLIRSFLITSVSQNKNIKIEGPIWSKLLIKESNESVLYFVNAILKKDKRYDELQEKYSEKLRIPELIKSRGIDSLETSDEFKTFDRFIIDIITKSLVNGSYDFDFYLKVIDDYRLTTIWYAEFENQYEFLRNAILLKKSADIDIESGQVPSEYITRYCDEYYIVDTHYRHAINAYSKINEPDDNQMALVEELDNTYENRFLSKLGGTFSKSLKTIEPTYDFGSIELSKNFFRKRLNRLAKKQFIIISDALRYEVGAELVKQLNQVDKFYGLAKLDYQITTLPSITPFGMSALLPNDSISYENKKVLIDGKSSDGTDNRDKILKSKSPNYAAIQYSEIIKKNRDELRRYMDDKNVVYIYHDTIDNAGEHDLDVFEACNTAIKEIIDLIKKLYNTLQISNYMITSDHGFIYRNKKIDASNKYNSFAGLGLDDYSQRYAIISNSLELNDSNVFDMNYLGGCTQKVFTPYSYDLYRKAGGGIQYIHGGSSLQELVTPVITLSEMRSRSTDKTVEPVKVRLKTATHKIMNKSFSLQFEQCEKVDGKKTQATLLVYFVDENNELISEKKVLIANKTTDNPLERIIDMRFLLMNKQYDRNKRYYLMMVDSETEEPVEDPVQFVIDIIGFKMF